LTGNVCLADLKDMNRKLQNGFLASVLALFCLSLPASAAGIFASFVLHPVRHEITASDVASADQAFAQLGATRVDLVATAPDGIILRGWKVRPAHPSGNWLLLLHGRSQNRLSMMGYARFLLSSGYSVVMMDARAHGESGGTIATYGHVERYDVKAVMDTLTATETVDHTYALGESMGAAVALQAAAVDSRIEGVIAEGAFRNLHEVMFDYAGLRWSAFLGKTIFRPAAILAVHEAEQQGGFRFDDVSPETSVSQRKFPIMLISGLSDHNIPKRHAQAIYTAAAGPKELWLVPRARHQGALRVAPKEFQQRVLSFLSSSQVAHQETTSTDRGNSISE
jgi:alpha-beta hydrolase superfamily lysophospholipase